MFNRLHIPKHALVFVVAAGLAATAPATAASDDVRMFRIGSWAEYSMKIADMRQQVEQAVEAAATPQPTAGAIPGMDPNMLAMLPPDKRAEIEAQMQAAQAQAAAQMKSVQATAAPQVAQTKKAAGSTVGTAGEMISEMKLRLRYSITGEETRAGKKYMWMDMTIDGQFPDMGAMWKKTEKMLRDMKLDEAKIQESKQAFEQGKKEMESLPIRSKDGKLKMAMRMLIDKVDNNTSFTGSLAPIEIWEKQGDNAPRKWSQAELDEHNGGNQTAMDRAREEAGTASGPKGMLGKIPGMGMARIGVGMVGGMQGAANQKTAAAKPKVQEVKGGLGFEGKPIVMKSSNETLGVEDVVAGPLGSVKAIRNRTSKDMKMENNAAILRSEQQDDIWMSPSVPGVGLAKMVGRTTTHQAEMKDPAMAAQQRYAPKIDMTTENTLELTTFGDTGAKPAF